MDPAANADKEIRRLRRTMRDLVALSTLPAVWIGLGPEGIARSLADALLNTLSLDLVYIRLAGAAGDGIIETICSKQGPNSPDWQAVREALAPVLTAGRAESPVTIADPSGTGTLNVAVTRFGIGDDQGILVAGSCNAEFPTEQDRVLLSVGANQTAIVVQRRRAEERLQAQQEWLRVTLASIGDAVIATDTAGRVTFLNSVAEELTGWTAADAQDKPLEEVFAIHNERTGQPVENPVEKVLRDGVTIGLANHTFLIAKDGSARPIDDSAAPIRDAAGKLLGVVLIFRDVTEQRRAEQEVRTSEARKSAILETALDCIVTMDHEGKIIEFNPAAEKTFGYCREEVVGRELAGLIIPAPLRERHRKGLAHYLATGAGPVLGQRLELAALHADGSVFPVELAITRIPTQGPPLFTAYLRDITARKRVEQHRSVRLAVTQILTQARTVQEAAGDVLQAVGESLGWDVGFFWTLDERQQALVCRRSWHKSGVPVTAFETASCNRNFRLGEGLPGRVWATGEPAWLFDVTRDSSFPRAASAATEGLHSAFACPLAVGNRLLGVIEFFTTRIREADLDLLEMMSTMAGAVAQFMERTQAEQGLRETVEHLSAVVETTPACIKIVSADGTLLDMNSVGLAMVGADCLEQVQGHCVYDLISDEHRAAYKAFNERICRGGSEAFEFDIVSLQGVRRRMEAHAAALRGPDGQFRQLAITQDITERKRDEQDLRDADRRKDEFLATLAHELRNPLAPIRMGLEVMKLAKDDPATVEETLHTMERQTQQLIALVDDLLDVSRITRGRLELRKCRVDLSDVLQSAVEASKPFIAEADHDLVITVPEEPIYLEVDPHRLAQVVSNLLNNAAKYTPDGGQIWLTAERHGGDVVVAVKDNGIGIPAGMRDRIFEMFAQIDRPMEKAYTGLGIGLTLVKSLVEMHGGRIEVHSDGGNRGSEFRVRLPILAELPGGESKSVQSGTLAHGRSKRRVLVVDDNKAAADMLGMVVRMLGNEVRTADDGLQAIDVAAEFLPHVILMDLGMPKLSGYEAARRIRQQPWGKAMMLVALTGWGQDEDKQRTKEAGFDHHLVKPAEPSELQKLLSLADAQTF